MDAVELSGGLLTGGKLSPSRPNINKPEKEAYFQEAAKAFKKALDVPLILVGGIRSPEVAERLLADGTADYFSMSRPLIREPDLVNRWQSGDRNPARGCKALDPCGYIYPVSVYTPSLVHDIPGVHPDAEGNRRLLPEGELDFNRAFHGLVQRLISNMVIGVTEGWTKELELVGVGYRASNQGQKLDLAVG